MATSPGWTPGAPPSIGVGDVLAADDGTGPDGTAGVPVAI
jgi:hypothetical protein